MSAKHTPGPWTVGKRRNLVVTKERERRDIVVADCRWTSSDAANSRLPTGEQAMANAELIAAAPDLAAVLEPSDPLGVLYQVELAADCLANPDLQIGVECEGLAAALRRFTRAARAALQKAGLA